LSFIVPEFATDPGAVTFTDPGLEAGDAIPLQLILGVSTPDGQVYTEVLNATAVVLTPYIPAIDPNPPVLGTATLTFPTDSVEIPTGSVVDGTYHVFIQVTNNSAGYVNVDGLEVSPTVDGDDIACTRSDANVALDPIVLIGDIMPGTSAQYDTEFTYDPQLFLD
jgi:hypothetical protein